MAQKASFIGLGSMGSAMAHNLLKQGVELGVYNRSKEKMKPLIDAGAKPLKHPSDAFQHAPLVISMLTNDQALIDITEGPHGLLESAHQGCVHISSSTVDPETIKRLNAKHQERGASIVTAPVFGRPDAAAKQELWICMAGDRQARGLAEPFLKMLGKKVYDFGDQPESASTLKLAGNFMILSAIETMGEAFSFVEKSGHKPEDFYNFLIETLFPSPVFINYGKILLQQRFNPAGFKLSLGAKDINLFLKSAKELNLSPAFAQDLQKLLKASIEKEREDMDWSAITMLTHEES